MTRFARAKGSKASNERLPDEPTPWHIMKQNLEAALNREQNKADESEGKIKTARQLLNEQEDRYYAKSLGNIATDWAEFESIECRNKKNNIKNGKVEKKAKDQNKKIKASLKKVITEEDTNNITVKSEKTSSGNFSKNETRLKESEAKQITSETYVDPNLSATKKKEKVRIDNDTEHSKDKIKSNIMKKKMSPQSSTDIVDDTKLKNKHQRKNEKRKFSEYKNNQEKSSMQSEKSIDNNSNLDNKISKRQKRNKKKQNQKHENENKNINVDTFNTEGNDWSNSVNFNNKQQFDNYNPNFINRNRSNNFKNKLSNLSIEEKNFLRFGNNVPRKFQKKVAKPRDDKEYKRRKPDINSIKVTINGMNVEIVKYDGFPIKKEDAERLTELRKEMVLKGIPKSEIDAAMKLERRKCEKALARIRRQVCFHCRKAGHNLSDCPELEKEETGTGICFKCGSTEHTHFECKVTKSDDYRYAKCFICREQGHIAKQCPDNPKGLYPDGGACKLCGDVTHLKKDCPDLVKEKEQSTITLHTINDSNLEALDAENHTHKLEAKPTKKVIKF